jgi:hypothetical protein
MMKSWIAYQSGSTTTLWNFNSTSNAKTKSPRNRRNDMTKYDPNIAIEDQAADAMSTAVSLCMAAGWYRKDIDGMLTVFFENNEAAVAAYSPRKWENV